LGGGCPLKSHLGFFPFFYCLIFYVNKPIFYLRSPVIVNIFFSANNI
jgi:hypothetical protein